MSLNVTMLGNLLVIADNIYYKQYDKRSYCLLKDFFDFY